MVILELLAIAILALLAIYVLAILLRVACHYCDVPIPYLGRAFFTAMVSAGGSVLATVLLQALLVGDTRGQILLQFVVLVLALVAHMMITVALYVPLLGLRVERAFSVWLVQAAIFAGMALLLGFCWAFLLFASR